MDYSGGKGGARFWIIIGTSGTLAQAGSCWAQKPDTLKMVRQQPLPASFFKTCERS